MNVKAEERAKKLYSRINNHLIQTDPEFAGLISDFALDEVISAGRLTEEERFLCILSALLGCQGHGIFKNTLHAALDAGINPVKIKEVLYQAAAYLGIGRTCDFLHEANEIMTAHGIRLPLEGQGTTNSVTRFEQGLAKQCELFGDDMKLRQTDGPDLRKHVNRWLAANCFGDYYTRNGLNDQEREMITFCFLLAQGGCENQLRGHTEGNFGVGNGKEKLYQVTEQCMPYIGYPRTLNAMNIIDEAAAKLGK